MKRPILEQTGLKRLKNFSKCYANLRRTGSESRGDGGSALAQELPRVYDELRDMAANYLRNERAEHTLQPTALVHEAYLRLIEQRRVDWSNRAQFFAVAAHMMRRILVGESATSAAVV